MSDRAEVEVQPLRGRVCRVFDFMSMQVRRAMRDTMLCVAPFSTPAPSMMSSPQSLLEVVRSHGADV